eukprot:TRINITY_DN4521_c0_g2_i1.p1 TRINITY_DN4521_c0_g2~~TRINITY_DN4521_c0_g2_i1.p1  ORF type:complete len:411 (-),score=75.88 TRINITY_DN4521_c0_g2_i1:468-1700(-)
MSEVSQAGVIAIAAILASKDHYATLDAPRDAPLSDLKKCYVKASLLVHPDKNPHPNATRAFQKVAGAWSVLNNEEDRHRYDMGLEDGNDVEEVFVTSDEAIKMFTFIAAATSFGTGGVAALGVSEMLHNQGGQGTDASEELVQGLPAALALSVAMITAGYGLSIAGFPCIGTYAKRVGCFQVVSQGIQIAQDPVAQKQVKGGFADASLYLRSAVEQYAVKNPTLGNFMEQIGSGISAADQVIREVAAPESFSRGCSGFQKQFLALGDQLNVIQCLGLAPEADSEQEDYEDESEAWFKEGLLRAKANQKKFRAETLVRMVNLKKAVELEGLLAKVVRYDRKIQRYIVRILEPVRSSLRSPASTSSSSSSSPHPMQASPDGEPTLKCVCAENLEPVVPFEDAEAPKSEMEFI